MPKPSLIVKPKKVTIYLPEEVVLRGRVISRQAGISLSQLVTDLLRDQSSNVRKVRIHADFPADEFDQIKTHAADSGMSIEDLVRTATYHLLDTKAR